MERLLKCQRLLGEVQEVTRRSGFRSSIEILFEEEKAVWKGNFLPTYRSYVNSRARKMAYRNVCTCVPDNISSATCYDNSGKSFNRPGKVALMTDTCDSTITAG